MEHSDVAALPQGVEEARPDVALPPVGAAVAHRFAVRVFRAVTQSPQDASQLAFRELVSARGLVLGGLPQFWPSTSLAQHSAPLHA